MHLRYFDVPLSNLYNKIIILSIKYHLCYDICMSIENKPESVGDFAAMMSLWGMIQQLGRNDAENSIGPRIIEDVQNRVISPAEGRRQMQALLDAKQVH